MVVGGQRRLEDAGNRLLRARTDEHAAGPDRRVAGGDRFAQPDGAARIGVAETGAPLARQVVRNGEAQADRAALLPEQTYLAVAVMRPSASHYGQDFTNIVLIIYFMRCRAEGVTTRARSVSYERRKTCRLA